MVEIVREREWRAQSLVSDHLGLLSVSSDDLLSILRLLLRINSISSTKYHPPLSAVCSLSACISASLSVCLCLSQSLSLYVLVYASLSSNNIQSLTIGLDCGGSPGTWPQFYN